MKKFTSPLVFAAVLAGVTISALSGPVGIEALSSLISAAGAKAEPEQVATAPGKFDDAAPSAPFTAGNLVIYRVGDGSAALSSNATAVFLDEYTTTGTSVQSIALPTAVNGANRRLVASGTATSEGFVSRSTDGQYLVMAGYDTALGTASITGSTSAAINRVIGRVDANGNVDSTTALTDAISGGNPRGAASTNGTDLWISGTSSGGGIRYAQFGQTTSVSLSTTPTNLRTPLIFGGQLYISANSGTTRLATVGTGTPQTAGQTITNLPGIPTATISPYSYFFADLDAGVAGFDTLYLTEDAAAGGVQKYSLVGGSWTSNGLITIATARGLVASVSGNNVTVFATNGTTLQTFTDTSGYNQPITGTPSVIATAPTNTAFRGVAFAPAAAGGNSGTIQLTSSTATVSEGTAFVTITASRTGGSTGSVGVAYATSNGTATAGPPCNAPGSDYNSANGSFVWGPGDTTDKSVTIPICDDSDFEGDENFNFTISTPTGGATLGTPSASLVTITDNDPQPTTIEFAAAIFVDEESQSATVTVTRSGNTSGTSTVDYVTGGGEAQPSIRCSFGADFVAKGGTLNFAASDTTEQFTVELCPDAFTEVSESFDVTLSNPTGGTLGTQSTAQVRINDTASKYRNPNPVVINDGAQSPVSTITVAGEAGPVGSLRVTLYDITHNSVGDIDVLLVGPGGQNILLIGDAGGATGLFGTRTLTLIDSAGQVLPQNGGFETGQYEPTSWTAGQPNFNSPAPAGPYNEPGSSVGGGPNLTSVFNGTNPNGTWSLYIRDDNGAAFSKRQSSAGGQNGTLFGGWGLEIFTSPGAATSISGNVSMPDFFGVRGVRVEVSGGGLSSPRSASTSSTGNYNITGLQAGQTYTIRFVNRRYIFAPTTATFTANGNLFNADAIAIPF